MAPVAEAVKSISYQSINQSLLCYVTFDNAPGSVSVVYLDDRGPDLVPEDYLFNPHLASAYAHPVLGPLSQQERLFSVKTTWNNTQRHIIRDWLSVTGQTMDRT